MIFDIISTLSSEMLLKFRSNSKFLPIAMIGRPLWRLPISTNQIRRWRVRCAEWWSASVLFEASSVGTCLQQVSADSEIYRKVPNSAERCQPVFAGKEGLCICLANVEVIRRVERIFPHK
ncbi:uncharacterized protein LOC114880892 [Osmia bicornis bicornis]|uniref:uncharacterized protein LOC114880892 n=1 Tax=Osmia bicornis bicornis TaxID=1437191 RepID=UPI0010F99CAA|nr:uncharacterized protein LOC114880892 [Osmia bicornis bicornis]